MSRRFALPAAIFAACALIYVLVLGERAFRPSPDNHFVHLANSFLHGQLGVVGNKPPGTNDWALYQGTWYVTFPPFPALVILPAVAVWGTATLDRLFWAIAAGLAPALLFVLLRRLSERGESERSLRDNLLLTALFALGSVYFYVAVQGTVWFAAHVVASSLLILYVLCSLDARRPLLAGVCLGLLFLTRTTTPLAVIIMVVEALRAYRRAASSAPVEPDAPALRHVAAFVRGADFAKVARTGLVFAAPVLTALALQLWLNDARFDDPLTHGYEFLQIKWKARIERWGLFDYHYFSKNLAVFVASLPWFSETPPRLTISLHGLALWFTTPNLLWLLWPKRVDARMVALYAAALAICVANLCYQNSGWIQFGYRFALDYMPFLIVLLALGRRRFGVGFVAALVFAVVVNAFGAFTFDRAWQYYDKDRTQNRVFQPD